MSERDERFWSSKKAARFIEVTDRTLRNWRKRRRGPPYYKRGGRIVYERGELQSWLQGRRAAA